MAVETVVGLPNHLAVKSLFARPRFIAGNDLPRPMARQLFRRLPRRRPQESLRPADARFHIFKFPGGGSFSGKPRRPLAWRSFFGQRHDDEIQPASASHYTVIGARDG
jgi:hypothetical protein